MDRQDKISRRQEALVQVAGMLAPDAYTTLQRMGSRLEANSDEVPRGPGWKYWPFPEIKLSTVGEHIFPKDWKYGLLAQQAEIQTWAPQNGLPVLKAIESELGRGNISRLPSLGLPNALDVRVSRHIWETPITTSCDEWARTGTKIYEIWAVKSSSRYQLKFGDLDRVTVNLRKKPFHRSLHQKALMAYKTHTDEFEHPSWLGGLLGKMWENGVAQEARPRCTFEWGTKDSL
eukprot:2523619-Amphidinium_carterae.1